MPIYEYQCPSCDHHFETIHKVSGPAPPCPECGGGVEKKISLAAFHLKGGGWYSDAYSGKDNKNPGGASGDSSSGDSSSTSSEPAKSGDSATTSSSSSDSGSTSTSKPSPSTSSTTSSSSSSSSSSSD